RGLWRARAHLLRELVHQLKGALVHGTCASPEDDLLGHLGTGRGAARWTHGAPPRRARTEGPRRAHKTRRNFLTLAPDRRNGRCTREGLVRTGLRDPLGGATPPCHSRSTATSPLWTPRSASAARRIRSTRTWPTCPRASASRRARTIRPAWASPS